MAHALAEALQQQGLTHPLHLTPGQIAALRQATRLAEDELALSHQRFSLWRFLVRYVTPVGVILVFLHAIGVV